MKHLFFRILKQLKNDKRSLALIFFAPLLVLTLLYFLLGDSNYKPLLSLKDLPIPIESALKETDATILNFPNNIQVDDYLIDREADAVIIYSDNKISIKMLESDSVKTSLVINTVKEALLTINPNSDIKVDFVYGQTSTNIYSSLGYVLLGMIAFFFSFLLAGISFIREKNYSTMERLLMTPIKRWEVIAGYTLGFSFFSAIQSTIIVLFTKYALGMSFVGPLPYAILIMILLSITAVSIGAFISIFSNNEFQIMQFIPIIIVPQIFFSGIISLDTIPFGLDKVAYFMPIYHGCEGLYQIMTRPTTFIDILPNISILLLITFVFSIINVLVLKKYRRI